MKPTLPTTNVAAPGWTLAVLAVVGSALALRLFHLGSESIWIDEMHSIVITRLPDAAVVRSVAADQHPPLYFLGLRYWVRIFGESEAAVRLPSVIFGTLTVWWMIGLGTLIHNRRVGLIAAMIVALSIFHLHYSQEARAYSLLAFLAVVSYAFLWQWLYQGSLAYAVGYVTSTVAMLYTHNYALFTVLAQCVGLLGLALLSDNTCKGMLRRGLVVQAVVGLLYLPWLHVLIRQVRFTVTERPGPPPPVAKLVGPFLTYAGIRPLFPILALLAAVAVIHACGRRPTRLKLDGGSRRARGSHTGRSALLLSWLIVPLAVPFVLSHLVAPMYLTRYMIGSSLAFYLLVAAGIELLPRAWSALALALIVVLSTAGIWKYYHAVNKEPWREVARHVDRDAVAGDAVVFHAGFIQRNFDYYSKRANVRKLPAPDLSAASGRDLTKWVSGLTASEHVWLVEAYHRDAEGRIRQAMLTSLEPVECWEYESESYATGKRLTITVSRFLQKRDP